MLNKLLAFAKRYEMVKPGERVVCAVSGGADSIALLFALYLLAPKLSITLEAAHFNHCLRGEESNADAEFVKQFCEGYQIPLHMGQGAVVAGKKGLEAAARAARYEFLEQLPGKIATAHTADDNAETLMMHMIRGTGLKGLGGIAPIRGKLIRPMLEVTRQEVLAFLDEYHLPWREDSTNQMDLFLRNRIRHSVMPLLRAENPNIAQNLTRMALQLREDEEALAVQAENQAAVVSQLRRLAPAVRSRWIRNFLQANGIPEPENDHVKLVERLIFSEKPSASADLPGGVRVCRCYDLLQVPPVLQPQRDEDIHLPVRLELAADRAILVLRQADNTPLSSDGVLLRSYGQLHIRTRKSGDKIRLPGGTKSLKKLFIDCKIPAEERNAIPVLADDEGVLWVCGFGPNLDRVTHQLPAIELRVEKI